MAQIFHRRANAIARATILGAVAAIGALGWAATEIDTSPYLTHQRVVRDQPVPFSHEHHVRGLGLDCRYCHTGVEDSHFAGIPPTKTCMTCHSKIWSDQPILQPLRDSWNTGVPLQWTRVHDLPDFAYFQHDIHIHKGISCYTCHGQVNEMPLMFRSATLQMEWCLRCHREPEKYLRPREEIYNPQFTVNSDVQARYTTPDIKVTDQESLGKELIRLYHIPTMRLDIPTGKADGSKLPYDNRLENCYTCHR